MLSCPAYFSDVQRDVMAAAGGDAGLVVLDTIDEPVVRKCVCVCVTEREREREEEKVRVYLAVRCCCLSYFITIIDRAGRLLLLHDCDISSLSHGYKLVPSRPTDSGRSIAKYRQLQASLTYLQWRAPAHLSRPDRCMLAFFLWKAAVMAAQDLSILPQGETGGLVGVLDVGGRSAQCSVVDTDGTAEVKMRHGRHVASCNTRAVARRRVPCHFPTSARIFGV